MISIDNTTIKIQNYLFTRKHTNLLFWRFL